MKVQDLNIGDVVVLSVGEFHIFRKEANGDRVAVRAYVHVADFSYGSPERAIYYLGHEEMTFFAGELLAPEKVRRASCK
jgi:hypothetical protein